MHMRQFILYACSYILARVLPLEAETNSRLSSGINSRLTISTLYRDRSDIALRPDINTVVKETDEIILEIEQKFKSPSSNLRRDVFSIFKEAFDNSATLADQEARIRNLTYFLKSDEIKASIDSMDLYVTKIQNSYYYDDGRLGSRPMTSLLQNHTKALKNAISLMEGLSFREKYNGLVEFYDTLKEYVDNRSQYVVNL